MKNFITGFLNLNKNNLIVRRVVDLMKIMAFVIGRMLVGQKIEGFTPLVSNAGQ